LIKQFSVASMIIRVIVVSAASNCKVDIVGCETKNENFCVGQRPEKTVLSVDVPCSLTGTRIKTGFSVFNPRLCNGFFDAVLE
jgi:hypothetical protein